MSIFSKAIKGIGSALGAVGDIGKKVAPLASFIPGVGPLAAAGIGAASAGLGKLNDKKVTLGNTLGSVAGGAALGGAGGYAIDKLQGLSGANGGGLAGAARGIMGGGGASPPAGGPAAATQPRSGIGGALGTIASTLGGGNGAENQLRALGLLGSAGGAYLAGRSEDQTNQFNQDQVTYARERNATFDPVRQQLLQTLISRLGGGSMPSTSAPPTGSATPPQPSAPAATPPRQPPGLRTGSGWMGNTPRPSPLAQAGGLSPGGPNINPVPVDRPTLSPPTMQPGWEAPLAGPIRRLGPSAGGIEGATPFGGGPSTFGTEMTQGWEGMNTPQRFPMPPSKPATAPFHPSYIDESPSVTPSRPIPSPSGAPPLIEPTMSPPPLQLPSTPAPPSFSPPALPMPQKPSLSPLGMEENDGSEENDPYDIFGRRRRQMSSSLM